MNLPTFEQFNYALRPAKNMERKMLCDALHRLCMIAPVCSYRYVGFGAVGFHDFSLFHQRLGINDMISIEHHDSASERIEFNRPYSCIQMQWGSSIDVLPILKWTRRAIVWLDYDGPLTRDVLADIATVVSSVRSGSIIIVTVLADPGFSNSTDAPKRRLQRLTEHVGKTRTQGITGSDLAKWGLATVSRRMILNQICDTLFERNGGRRHRERLEYLQLFNFHYADGTKMLTTGGVLCNLRDKERLGNHAVDGLDFIRTGTDPYRIEVPVLTTREIAHLNERLPKRKANIRYPNWIPVTEREKYQRIYRYFPSFGEVESAR